MQSVQTRARSSSWSFLGVGLDLQGVTNPVTKCSPRGMGWTVSYQVLRERPLDEAEVIKLAELVRRQQKLPWDSESFNLRVPKSPRADRVIADGWNKVSMGSTSNDVELVKAAVNEMHALLGGELRVSDDFRALSKTAPPIQVAYEELVAVTT